MKWSQTKCLGWRPDIPDFRDYTLDQERQLGTLARFDLENRKLPNRVDHRLFFTPNPVSAVDSLHAMSEAVASLYAYFEYRTSGTLLFPCSRFLAKSSERLANARSGTGPSYRDVFRAMRRCGMPPETCTHACFDQPNWWLDPMLYMFREECQPVKYLRVDADRSMSSIEVLHSIRQLLSIGMPVVFGFSFSGNVPSGTIFEYRPTFEGVLAGISSIAVGYNDKLYSSCRGALLVRMPWGHEWGESGYGWLPYDYVLTNAARDFWTITKPVWLESPELQNEMDGSGYR